MNLPNKLTLLRVFLIPVFLVLVYLDFPFHMYIALGVFILASVTDFIDGYLARSRNLVTDFGKFMDPLADKLLVLSAMLWFVEVGKMPAWCLLIVVAREFAVTALRLIAVDNGRVIAAAWSGKVKTFSTMIGICIILLLSEQSWLAANTARSIEILCVTVIVLTTLYSGVEYFLKNKDVFQGSL